jgi:hypothetical protein
MGASVLDRVLSVEEVRKQMRAVNDAARNQGAVIHYGERGEDELVIMSAAFYQQLLAERLHAAAMQPGPYAAFNRAIVEGRLGRELKPAVRRRMLGLRDESSVSLEQMIALGSDDRTPARRRVASR